MRILQALSVALMTLFASNVNGTDIGASDLSIVKILFISGNYSAAGDRGEIWVRINQSVAGIHSGCLGDYSSQGYLVAAFPDDVYGRQYISGLLTAKTSGTTIRIGIDDSRKNSRGMCFLSYYEMD